MSHKNIPNIFKCLLSDMCIDKHDILETSDGFYMVHKSIASILATKSIFDFPDPDGVRLACDKFFDDWYLYAVRSGDEYVYSLLKLREQEYDAEYGVPADGDTPGVTVSFISFDCIALFNCLEDPCDKNRADLSAEIHRVVLYKKQRHHRLLKRYFKNPSSDGSYLIAAAYVRHIASYAGSGYVDTPEHYRKIVQRSISYKKVTKHTRLPRFIEALNREAGYTVCDNEKIYIANKEELNEYETAAILATHTANTSVYSFAAEVEYHARFLFGLAKIKIPFFGISVYDSAIRADMTIDDAEFEGNAPFHRSDSAIVRRQRRLHSHKKFINIKNM